MLCSISNGTLSVQIETHGAEIRSIVSESGTEYIWQRDKAYWADSAPLLFPYIARLYKNSYTLNGKTYEMGIHGFAAQSDFLVEAATASSVTLLLEENEATLCHYPFCFSLHVKYSLEGSGLCVTYTVDNRDTKPMPFAIGGHPGFNVPFVSGTDFSDYTISFASDCVPDRIGFSDDLLLSGENKPYPLENGRTIRLNHNLFDEDAIILTNMAREVTLACDLVPNKITVSYPDMRYLGLWHMPCTDAPYVCIEPWSSLPSRHGIVEEFTCKGDMITLNQGESYQTQWKVTITEKP